MSILNRTPNQPRYRSKSVGEAAAPFVSRLVIDFRLFSKSPLLDEYFQIQRKERRIGQGELVLSSSVVRRGNGDD